MQLSRRNIFRLVVPKQKENLISPPYFSGTYNCQNCHAPCVDSCEFNLLCFVDDKISFIEKNYGCTFCKECANSCERNVLDLSFKEAINAQIRINLNSCLAWNEVVCYSCHDACCYDAISYFGLFRPQINQNCVGCAMCLSACFNNSLTMESK